MRIVLPGLGALAVLATARCEEVNALARRRGLVRVALAWRFHSAWLMAKVLTVDEELGEDVRFKNHGITPKSAADFAFLLHGFHHLKDQV